MCDLYNKIESLCFERGIKIADLARETEINKTLFSDLKRQKTKSLCMDRLIVVADYFDVSLDALILGNDNRVVDEMKKTKVIKPHYKNIHDWEFYSSNLLLEYQESIDEGLDIDVYNDVFSSISRLPKGEIKKKLGDVLFEAVTSANQREGYPYIEPSELEQIKGLRKEHNALLKYNSYGMENKIHGAWMGRVCGCMLGKSIEGIRTDELIPFLEETKNYPMHRYIYKSDLTDEIIKKYKFGFFEQFYADKIDGMPIDDDTNYVVLAQEIIDKHGRNFTPYDVASAWLKYQSKSQKNIILILFRFRTDLMNYPLMVTQLIGPLTAFIPLSKDIRLLKKNYGRLLKNTYKYCVRKIIVKKLKTKKYQK
jgi:transcriptional regulator with XRE-family HTH domain